MFNPSLSSCNVPELVYALGSQMTLANATVISGLMEVSFYSSLKGGMQETTRFIRWIRETSIAHIHLIQDIFNCINFGIFLFSTKNLVDEVANRYSISILNQGIHAGLFKSISVIVTSAATAGLIAYNLDRLSPFPDVERIEEGLNSITIEENPYNSQTAAQCFHISKLVMSVALACFMNNRLTAAISIVNSIYCLWKETKLRWITISSQRDFPMTNNSVSKVKASYRILALPVSDSTTEQNRECSICWEKNTMEKIAFCAHHTFCKGCIIQYIATNSNNFFENSEYKKQTTHHYRKGIHTHTSHKYEVIIPSNKLPTCPDCRTAPPKNICEFEIEDRVNGIFQADVVITDPPAIDNQPLFETLYAIYNTVQAGLAYLQSYPELAVTIFKIQKLMLVTDLIGLGMTIYFLAKKIVEKYDLDALLPPLFMGALVGGITAVYFANKWSRYMKSTVILKEILAQLNFSPELLKGVDINWHRPVSHYLMSDLYVVRILSMGALTLFSKQWKQNVLSIAGQLLSLAGICKLKWIVLTQTLDYPVQQIIDNGGKFPSLFNKKSLETLTLKTEFLVDPATNIQSTVKSIFSCTQSFFNNSEWNRYWRIFYSNGIEMNRKIEYSIKLQNNPFTTYSGSFLPSLTSYKIKLIDSLSLYGKAMALVKY